MKKKNEEIIEIPPEWARGIVWYQIFPERFRRGSTKNDPKPQYINVTEIDGWKIKDWGSDWYAMDAWEKKNFQNVFQSIFYRRYGGDIQGIIDKLDYLKDLGVGAIYLNPVFRSPSLHKYDGSSFHHIEETFGPAPEKDRELPAKSNETEDPETWVWTEADKLFLKLIKEVHKRSMRIIIDGVFNHSGRLFFAFQDILNKKTNSKYKNWYEIFDWDVSEEEGDGFKYKSWFGIDTLPEFKRDKNNLNEEVKKYIFNITKRWMAPNGNVSDGVDGWRLDVAFCLPHNFWKEWRKLVKSINSNAYITGEVMEIAPEYLQGDEFDALMNYPFAYTVSEFFIDKKNKISVQEFSNKLQHLRESYSPAVTEVMQNLISSHDTSRLLTLINNPDMNYRQSNRHFQNSKIENNNNYIIERGGMEEKKIHKLIVIFKMTYVGSPMIYYGDEVGMTGANDPDCRKPMLWDDMRYDDEKVHPVKNRTRKVEKNVIDYELFNHYKKMIKIRNESKALKCGSFKTVYIDNERDIFGYVREYKDEINAIFINNSNNEQIVEVKVNDIANNNGNSIDKFIDILNGIYFNKTENDTIILKIPEKWAVILERIHKR